MPLQTLRTSNSSLSSRAFVRVRWFEAAHRLVIVRPALARQHRNLDLFRKYFRTLDLITNFLHARSGPGAW